MRNKKSFILLAACISFFYSLQPTEQIGQDSTNTDFQEDISVKAFDRYDGTFYVGTAAANGDYSIAKAGRTATVFTGISTEAGAQGKIDYMALCNYGGNGTTYLPFNLNGSNELRFIKLSDNSIPGNMTKPSGTVASGNICDANGQPAYTANPYTNLAGGSTTDGSKTYVFLRVNGSGGLNVGQSGILAYEIETGDTVTKIAKTNGNAAKLDNKKGLIAGDGNFLRPGSTSAELNVKPIISDMYWDTTLGTLFISTNSAVPKQTDNRVMAITKLKINGGILALSDLLPFDSTIPANSVNPAQNDLTTIFAGRSSTATVVTPRIFKIRTMHTSTNKTYLIVNGAIGIEGTVENKFHALRYNSSSGHIVANDEDGTTLVDGFVIHTDTVANKSLDGLNTDSLVIGGEDAPWQAGANLSASDMEVIGDTVYVSFAGANRDGDNDPGIWSSQALFDNDGVIIGWTKWERVFRSENSDNKDKAKFFAVDATNAKLWQVNNDNGSNPTVVRRMQWLTSDFGTAALSTKLTSSLSDGCTCVLDLPKKTPGLGIPAGANKDNSFALFGGIEKIVFARTKKENLNEVIINFSDENYNLTTLSGAGVVRCLGYSRNKTDNTRGYFLAGTNNGLYVFASSTKTGFNGSTGLTDLNSAPFDTFTWQRMAESTITGGISAIESDGEYLYAIEQDINSINSITSRLWRIEIGNTYNANAPIEIAKSDSGDLPENSIFTGIKIITDVTGTEGQARGILCTNSGIYRSPAFLSVTALTDDWQAIDETNAYYALFSPKRVPTTVAPYDGTAHKVLGIAFADDGTTYYQQSDFLQFNSNNAMNATTEPADAAYTNKDMATGTDKLEYLDRSLYLYSDGGRRLYTRFSASDGNYNSLQLLPYSANEWNMIAPSKISDLSDVTRIHWIENISGLGIILCGTDTGVIALQ